MEVRNGGLRQTVASLGEAVGTADAALRLAAINQLGRLGPRARGSVSALVSALNDDDRAVRRLAALALGEIGSREAVSALRAALRDDDPHVRRYAALALMNIGAESIGVTDPLPEPLEIRFL